MPTSNYPQNYLNRIDSSSKAFNVVLKLDGLEDVYCLSPIKKKIYFGEPGLRFGVGYSFGDIANDPNAKPYIIYDTSMVISQTLEPEQGRASITTFNVNLVDYKGNVSKVVSPGGGVLDEVLGRTVTIYLGFPDSVFPNDYYVAYRGLISDVTVTPGKVGLIFGDLNQKRRTAVFKVQKALVTSPVSDVAVTVSVDDASSFYAQILGPDNTYDSSVTLYVIIDDETMQYSSVTSSTTINISQRGARGTVAATHDVGADVTPTVQITGHPLTTALKIMLSGWNGPYLEDILCSSIGTYGNDSLILLPTIDANIDYGLTVGDYVTISGSSAGNDGTYSITSMETPDGITNNLLRLNGTFSAEDPATSVTLSFRSKYDTLPTYCGLQLSPQDVDVLGHEDLRDNFLNSGIYDMNIYVQSQQTGKDFIEQQLYLPIGCYSLTRYGRLSVNQTRPPIANTNLQFLNINNIIDPDKTQIRRGLNTRKFWNNIQFQYDQQDDGNFSSVLREVDSESLNKIGLNQVLPIQSNGIKTELGGAALVEKVAQYLLSRYKNSAAEITLKTNFATGTLIEVGDVVALQDDGYLYLTNFSDGSRNLGTQLYEVTNRSFNCSTGQIQLKLTAGVQGQAQDRYGTVSPSSVIASATGANYIEVNSSYNPTSADEAYKWTDYIGLPILVHDSEWNNETQVTLTKVDNVSDPVRLYYSGTLGYSVASGDIVDVPQYPTSTDPTINALYKLIHGFADPTIAVSGISDTSFLVGSSDISKFNSGSLL